MKATIESTSAIVDINDPSGRVASARVWEGVTEGGIKFVAYITSIQVAARDDQNEFAKGLIEHKKPDPATVRAIDMRFIL